MEVFIADNETDYDDLELGKVYRGRIKNGKIWLNGKLSGRIKGKVKEGESVTAELIGVGEEYEFQKVNEKKAEIIRMSKKFEPKNISEIKNGERVEVKCKVLGYEAKDAIVWDGSYTRVKNLDRNEYLEGKGIKVYGIVKENEIIAKKVETIEFPKTPKIVVNKTGIFYLEDSVTKKLFPLFEKAAKKIERAVLNIQPIFIRYHSDTDGLCSALNISKAVEYLIEKYKIPIKNLREFLEIKEGEAVYEIKEAMKDAQKERVFSKEPLIIITDCGANEESFEAVEALKKSGYEIIIIDHHPYCDKTRKIVDIFVSPFLVGGNSDYCAGLLTYSVAKMIHPKLPIKYIEWALQGDKSIFAKKTDYKEPLVFDYIIRDRNFEKSLKFFEKIIEDKKFINEKFNEASKKIEWALNNAKKYTKIKKISGCWVVVSKLDKFCKKGRFPSKSRTTNAVHMQYSKQYLGPLITLGIAQNSLSIRATRDALKLGFSANKLIKDMKRELGYAVLSGGGHDVAAALKIKKGYENEVKEFIEKWIEKINKTKE